MEDGFGRFRGQKEAGVYPEMDERDERDDEKGIQSGTRCWEVCISQVAQDLVSNGGWKDVERFETDASFHGGYLLTLYIIAYSLFLKAHQP